MKHFSLDMKRVLALSLLLAFALAALTPMTASADVGLFDGHDGDCVIPDSGPWPPCATGGSAPAGGDCVIPDSGPWPPCATGGSAAPGGTGGCVIPDSGPWPPCASGGGTAPAPGGTGDCVIPDSGPWPPCATGGGPAPAPANPAPAPAPAPAPDADPAAEEPIGLITLVYNSNPDEVLGVFPVFEFNAGTLFIRMLFNHVTLEVMRDNLNGALSGDAAACDRYEEAYEVMKASGGFYVDVPGDWQGIHDTYLEAFIVGLDRTRPAYLSCLNSDRVDDFNYGLAFTAIEDSLNMLRPVLEQAAAKVSQ